MISDTLTHVSPSRPDHLKFADMNTALAMRIMAMQIRMEANLWPSKDEAVSSHVGVLTVHFPTENRPATALGCR